MRHNRLQRELLLVQNNASLRSRERGLQARKELLAFEKKVEESRKLYGPLNPLQLRSIIQLTFFSLDQDLEEIEPSNIQEELHEASDLLTELQNQMTSVSSRSSSPVDFELMYLLICS